MKLTCQILLLFTLATTLGCADPNFMDKTQINGSILQGQPVSPGDDLHGRTVFIAKNFSATPTSDSDKVNVVKFGICSGVILDAYHILTAAHCTNNYKHSRIILADDVNKPVAENQIYEIDKAINHPLYEKKLSKEYDLAILKLNRQITTKTDAKFLSLAPSRNISFNSLNLIAHIAGFGRTSDLNDPQSINDEPVNGQLLKAQVKLHISQFDERLITLNQRNNAGVCIGDSGGPLFIERDNELYLQAIAIATYKVNSEDSENKHNPCYGNAIYLNLDMHKQWIRLNSL